MPITLISSVIEYQNELVIGINNELVVSCQEDLKLFYKLTTSPNKINYLLMGKNTYFSIKNRPLKNRYNLVLTNNKELLKNSKLNNTLKLSNLSLNQPHFITLDTFYKLYQKYERKNKDLNVFIIGGSKVYNHFLSSSNTLTTNNDLRADKVYLTHIKPNSELKERLNLNKFNLKTIKALDFPYQLISYSENFIQDGFSYRILQYRLFNNEKSQEEKYLDLVSKVLFNGNKRSDRTGTGTISQFGAQLKFDISKSIPLLTTKRVPFKAVVEELLWFCRGDTDAQILNEKGIKIWNGNSSREFLDKRGLIHYPQGICGPIYGWQLRFQGAHYHPSLADTSKTNTKKIGGFDQIEYVIHLLKTDPFSRRILISFWNTADMDKMCLNPCHFSIQFYVEEINNQKYLSSHFTMRSSDLGCGLPFNLASYAVLTYIIAIKCDMKPKNLIYSGGDTHIYSNHIQGLTEQLFRTPRPFPKLFLNPEIKNKDFSEILFSDFELIGYFPHPSIKLEMAV